MERIFRAFDPSRADIQTSTVGLVIIFAGFFIAIPRFLLGEHGYVRLHDTFDSEFPRIYELAKQLNFSNFTEWYPKLAGGVPASAYHFSHLDPLVLLAKISPPWLMYQLIVVVLFIIALCGFYWLARMAFETKKSIALCGALFITFEFYPSQILTTFNFLFPIIFCCLHDRRQNAMTKNVGFAIIIAILSLSNYPIMTCAAYSFMHVLLLIILSTTRGQVTKVDFVKMVLFWLAISIDFIPSLVNLLDFFDFHHRAYAGGEYGGLGHLANLIVSNFVSWGYFESFNTGFGAILFMGLVLSIEAKKTRVIILCILINITVLTLVSKDFHYLVSDTFIEKMDLTQMGWSRPILYFMLFIAVLSDFHYCSKKLRSISVIVGVLSLGSLIVLSSNNMVVSTTVLRNTIGLILVLLWLYPVQQKMPEISGISMMVTIVSMMALATTGIARLKTAESIQYKSAMGKEPVMMALSKLSQEKPFRVASVGGQPGQMQLNGLETFGGRSPLFNKNYKKLSEIVINKNLIEPKNLKNYRNYWYQIKLEDLVGHSINYEALNLDGFAVMNVCYILSKLNLPNLEPIKTSELLGQNHTYQNGLNVYRVPNCQDRINLISHQQFYSTSNETLAAMQAAPFKQLTNTAWFDHQQNTQKLPVNGGRCGTITASNIKPDGIEVKVKSDRKCLLLINNNFHHNWQATINSKKVGIVRANIAFMGVYLPGEGQFDVQLKFVSIFGLWQYLFPIIGILLIIIAIRLPFPAPLLRTP